MQGQFVKISSETNLVSEFCPYRAERDAEFIPAMTMLWKTYCRKSAKQTQKMKITN